MRTRRWSSVPPLLLAAAPAVAPAADLSGSLVDYWYGGVGLRAALGHGVEGQLRWVETKPDQVGFARTRLSFLLTASF